MRLTLKKALEESIRKWKVIIKNNGELNYELMEQEGFSQYASHCALCEKYVGRDSKRYGRGDGCNYCPLCPVSDLYHKPYDITKAVICCEAFGQYNTYDRDEEARLKGAQAMLDKLQAIYDERYS